MPLIAEYFVPPIAEYFMRDPLLAGEFSAVAMPHKCKISTPGTGVSIYLSEVNT
jgi:hypothetical protein